MLLVQSSALHAMRLSGVCEHMLHAMSSLLAAPRQCMQAACACMCAQLFPDGSRLKLERRANIVWDEGGPRSALLVKKPNSPAATQKLAEIGQWCVLWRALLSLLARPPVAPASFYSHSTAFHQRRACIRGMPG